jgi:ABC-type ATPase involved in cell division
LRHRGMTVLMATHNEALLAPGMRHVRCVIGTLEEIACAPVS